MEANDSTPTPSIWSRLTQMTLPLNWLYGLAFTPALTDLIENGHLPRYPREWITEVTVGIVIALLVHRVVKEHAAVQALSRQDALTGLLNRRAFDEALSAECNRKRRSGLSLSLVYLDLDCFKQINDQLGHETGDRVLQQFASAITQVIRSQVDRGYRLGGDEFALLLPYSRGHQAHALVERLRKVCQQLDALWQQGQLGVSAGVVEFDTQETADEFVKRADAAMYQNKHAQRTTKK